MKFATCMAVVICSAVSAQAAQPVSNDSLKSVGLSNIVVMSDAQGTQVRAKWVYYDSDGNVVIIGASQGMSWSVGGLQQQRLLFNKQIIGGTARFASLNYIQGPR